MRKFIFCCFSLMLAAMLVGCGGNKTAEVNENVDSTLVDSGDSCGSDTVGCDSVI